jgi:hypothetical protein
MEVSIYYFFIHYFNLTSESMLKWGLGYVLRRVSKLKYSFQQWLAAGRWFSPGALVSSTNKNEHDDITEILEEEEIRLLREKRVGYLCSQVTHCTLFKWILGVSNFISTPAYLFQFEFICKLYMDNVLIKFENHIPPPKF